MGWGSEGCANLRACTRGARSLLSTGRTRAASSAAGQGLRSGPCSLQPPRSVDLRAAQSTPRGPLCLQAIPNSAPRGDTKGQRGQTAQARAAAEDAGSGGPAAPRERPSRAGPQPLSEPCACASTSASLGPACSVLLAEDSSLVLGVREALPAPPHLLLVQIGRRGKSRQGIGCCRCQFRPGALFIPRSGAGGMQFSLEDGGCAQCSRVWRVAVWRLVRPRSVLRGAGLLPAVPGRRAAPPSRSATECQTPSKVSCRRPSLPRVAPQLSPPRPWPPSDSDRPRPRAGRPSRPRRPPARDGEGRECGGGGAASGRRREGGGGTHARCARG